MEGMISRLRRGCSQYDIDTAYLDAYVAVDARHVTLLGLVDLSAAFDTVDHWILIERLRRTFGVVGRSLDWVISYLTGRTQFVRFNGKTSDITSVSCGVRQGSVLGPTLFIAKLATVVGLCNRMTEDRNQSITVHNADRQT